MANVDFSWECDCSFPDHPKIVDLSLLMKTRIELAGWALVRLFCRARRFAPSGDLSTVSDATLFTWTGTRRLTFAVLAEAGLIDVSADGSKVLHGWAERRYDEKDDRRKRILEQTRIRVERWRARENGNNGDGSRNHDVTRNMSVDVTPMKRDCNTNVRDDVEVEAVLRTAFSTSIPSKSSITRDVWDADTAVRPKSRSPELAAKWNELAVQVPGWAQVEKLLPEMRAAADKQIAEGLLERWDEFVAAALHEANEWHRATRLTFRWLIRRNGPWRSLCEKAKAGTPVPVRTDQQKLLDRLFCDNPSEPPPEPSETGETP